MNKRVVVTGIGVVSPVGIGLEKYWNALKAGKSGINLITHFDASDIDAKIAGEVNDFNPEEYISKKEVKRMDRFAQFAVATAKMALEDSGIDTETEDMNRFGVILGSGIGGVKTFETECEKMLEKGPGRISPFFIPMMITNMGSGHIAIATGAKGPNTTVVTACASSTHAIGDAFKIIERGDADLMFAGGSEASITKLSMAGFCSMKALSTRNDDPKGASRPFDKNRDGFIMSEGSGMLILEEYEHAIKRNAKIYAEIVGYGYTADAFHITSPAVDGEGASRAMKMAIDDAEIDVKEIDHINAHGTSTPLNDKFETMAIKTVFGKHAYDISINSTKSITGHLLGAAGSIEAIASIMALKEGFIPPTINYSEPDQGMDLDYTPNNGKKRDIKYALSNSLGFGGHNGSLVFKKYND